MKEVIKSKGRSGESLERMEERVKMEDKELLG